MCFTLLIYGMDQIFVAPSGNSQFTYFLQTYQKHFLVQCRYLTSNRPSWVFLICTDCLSRQDIFITQQTDVIFLLLFFVYRFFFAFFTVYLQSLYWAVYAIVIATVESGHQSYITVLLLLLLSCNHYIVTYGRFL